MKLKVMIVFLSLTVCASISYAEKYNFVTLEYPPLEYEGSDGTAQGIAVDIVKEIMTNLGHEVDIKVLPWTRALKKTKAGNVDAIFTAYKNPEREKFLDYSKGILVPQIVTLYVKKESNIQFNGDLLQLKGKKFGVISTISYGDVFDKLRDQLQLSRAETLESSLKKLIADRVDLVISNIYSADVEIKKLKFQDKVKKLSPVVQSVPSYIAFSKAKGLTELRDSFDKELEKIIKDGTYDKILAKYGVVIQQ